MDAAELSTDNRNSLKGSTFAYPKQRKLPLSDAAHVRNALARFNQVSGVTPEEKAAAKDRIKSAAKKFGVEVSADFTEWDRFGQPLLVALAEEPLKGREGQPLPFVKVSDHHFADLGDVVVTEEDLDRIVTNYKVAARRGDLPIANEEHIPPVYSEAGEVQMGPGAVGWIKDMYRDGDTVYFVPDWNAAGERLIQEDRYRGISPELLLDWTDPETGEHWGMTAAGVALTNKPRMKNLAHQGSPMAASEGKVLAFVESAAVHIDGPMQDFSVSWAFNDPKRFPLHSPAAVKGASARFMTVEAGEADRDEAWSRIRQAAQEHGVQVPESWRALKASECAALLMAEGDGSDDAGLQAPCMYQPPQGACPGYTRSDPDGDGDADCCLMAGRGCNGYVPVDLRATFTPGQGAVYGYHEPPKKGELMPEEQEPQSPTPEQAQAGDQPAPAASSQEPAPAAAPASSAVISTPAGSVTTTATTNPTVGTITFPNATTTGTGASLAPQPSGAADMAEFRNLLAAEKREREAMSTKLSEAQDQIRRMEAAEGLKAVTDRLETCVREGKITPADRAQLSERTAHFAENPWLLELFESRPKGSAVPFGEKGSGEPEADVSEGEKLDRAAKALMSERQQSTDPKGKDFYRNYRAAVVEVSRSGYRG